MRVDLALVVHVAVDVDERERGLPSSSRWQISIDVYRYLPSTGIHRYLKDVLSAVFYFIFTFLGIFRRYF